MSGQFKCMVNRWRDIIESADKLFDCRLKSGTKLLSSFQTRNDLSDAHKLRGTDMASCRFYKLHSVLARLSTGTTLQRPQSKLSKF